MRRATLEDLAGLRPLWVQAPRGAAELEKQLTEFQVAVASDGTLLACIGLRIAGPHAKVHHETYRSLEMKTELRDAVWERVQSVARNHGLCRIWIEEADAVWRERGFVEAEPALLRKLPASFGDRGRSWKTLPLREEISPAVSLEREFELFKQSQREKSDRALRRARALKVVAGFIAAGTLALALGALGYVLRRVVSRGRP